MTTIVYDHENQKIAIDSRCCAGSRIINDKTIKWKYVDSAIWFIAGQCADFEMLMNCYNNKETKEGIIPQAAAFIVENKKVIFFEVLDDGVINKLELSASEPLGTGGNWALAALDHGKTAKQAVEYAKTRDCNTGGKVHVFDIKKNKFVSK